MIKIVYNPNKEEHHVRSRNTLIKATMFIVAILLIGFSVSTIMTGCVSTGTTTTTVSTGPTEEELARQKAKQDSLNEAYERQLLIAFSTGNEHHKNKLYHDAIKPLWKASKMDTSNRFPQIYTKLGDSYIKLDQPDSALVVYLEASERYPDNAFYHRSAAWLLSAKQQIPEAIDEYYKAIEKDGETISDYKNIGPLLVAEDRTDEALQIYEKITQMDPNDGEAQNIYAQLLSSTGDEDAVIEAKEKALAAKPDDTTLMFSLGQMYFKRSEYDQAIKKFDMLLAVNPDDADALEYKGNAQQNNSDFKNAISTYEKVLALKPDHAKVMCEMASCYRELKNYQKAMSVVNSAIRINSSFGLGYVVKGEIFESVADNCVSQREKRVTNFDDKLVYKLAYDQYALAAQKDVQYADMAKRKMNIITTEIPTKEDYFMHPDQKQPQLDCYTWLN